MRIAVRREIAFDEQAPRIGADQERPVAPSANEIAVVPSTLDHQISEAECEHSIGARSHSEPEVCLGSEPDVTWIDHDQPHAALTRFGNGGRMSEAGEAGVVAP